jgi:hypothetical protein
MEPIKPVIKSDRSGLGRSEAEAEKRRRVLDETLVRASDRETLTRDFRLQKSAALAGKIVAKDLTSSQRTCRELDDVVGVAEPEFSWSRPLENFALLLCLVWGEARY